MNAAQSSHDRLQVHSGDRTPARRAGPGVATGEERTASLLESLTGRTRRYRLLHRPPSWRVLHSVPLQGGRSDIDHVLIGPPGVCVINTRHHRAGRCCSTGTRSSSTGPEVGLVPVRPVIAIVGAAMQVRRWPDDVIVATEGALVAPCAV